MLGTLNPNGELLIRDTGTAKGRGVFAQRPYAPGDLVEASPILEVRGAWAELPSEIRRMVYDWAFLTGTDERDLHALALGAGSLFNHAAAPNLAYQGDRARRALVFTATRAIASGEELTIDYNGDVDPISGGEWFQSLGIDPVE